MCGIVGLFLKTERHEQELGRLTALMLEQMRDRGPDSAGFAVYGDDRDDRTRLTVLAEGVDVDWGEVCGRLSENLESEVSYRTILDHAVIETPAAGSEARRWIIDHVPEVTVLGFGHAIEIYKAVGDPKLVAERHGLAGRRGTHAIAGYNRRTVNQWLRLREPGDTQAPVKARRKARKNRRRRYEDLPSAKTDTNTDP